MLVLIVSFTAVHALYWADMRMRTPLVPAIALLARVVHGVDVSADRDSTPESPGLLAIADGFALLGVDDQRQLELELPVYDALYAWAQHQVAAG